MVYIVSVDVGTSSVRAALFTIKGKIVNYHTESITIWQPCQDYYEQSSSNIWEAVCTCVKAVVKDVKADDVRGIGFDATCSLVVLDKDMSPLTVSPSGNNEQNVVMWMDHRASDQSKRINACNHHVLKYVGSKVSLEMEPPKLLWLKENLYESCWKKAGHFVELPDFLTWKCTSVMTRSVCSVVCKWLYEFDPTNKKSAWSSSFWQQIGLSDLVDEGFSRIGLEVCEPGKICGNGLTLKAASELGLNEKTPVASSIIDAHAGGIGCIGCTVSSRLGEEVPISNRMVMICGTSICHLTLNDNGVFVPGLWGPYYSAMISNKWCHEGGQSAGGKLIDHIIESHPAYPILKGRATIRETHIHDELNRILIDMAEKQGFDNVAYLTKNYHIWPDFHGNRSPLSDPSLTGMICGLTLSCLVEDLAIQYLSTIQGLAYGTRHIIETLECHGYNIKVIHACGGLSKNSLYVQTHADVTGLPLVLPYESESVLLGAAILGAMASGLYADMKEAQLSMCGKGDEVIPSISLKSFHAKKYAVFRLMVQHQHLYKDIMSDKLPLKQTNETTSINNR